MATDGPTPPPCNQDLYQNGESAGVFETYGANHFEGLIAKVRLETKCQVDWHYVGGRAVVRCYAQDVEKVKAALDKYVVPVLAEKRQAYLAGIPQLLGLVRR